MENLSYRILQDLFTTKSFYDIAITYRREMESAVATALQQRLDARYGHRGSRGQRQDIHPPVMISDSFENVIASYQKKEETINLALEYRNNEIPASRGKAYGQRARAYIQEEVLKSEAAVAGFLKVERLPPPQGRHPQGTHFHSIVNALREREKILVDPRTGEMDLYLTSGAAAPLPEPGVKEP